MKASALPLTALLLLLGGCAGLGGDDSALQMVTASTVDRLTQREWDLKGLTVDGHQVVMDVAAQLTLSFGPDGRVTGFGGVNRFGGTYEVSADGKLTWTGAGFTATRKAGPPELMDKERAYLDGLRKVNVALLRKHGLTLQSDDSSTVLTFDEAGY